MKKNLLLLLSLLTLTVSGTLAAPRSESSVIYKSIDNIELSLTIIAPEGYLSGKPKSSIVFFHGGGWKGGLPKDFRDQARYFADEGIVCFSVQYRLESSNNTTPLESLKDAKSAMRYIRSHAQQFNINPERIITSGGSAGGHLAAAVTLCPEINESSDDLSISSSAYANILFNPVICNGPGGKISEKAYGYSRVKEYWQDFSPMHNIRKGVPPTLFMVGDSDKLIPTEVAHEYQRRIESVGGKCKVVIYEGRGHGFYHIKREEDKVIDTTNFTESVTDAHLFLREIGVLTTSPRVTEWLEENIL